MSKMTLNTWMVIIKLSNLVPGIYPRALEFLELSQDQREGHNQRLSEGRKYQLFGYTNTNTRAHLYKHSREHQIELPTLSELYLAYSQTRTYFTVASLVIMAWASGMGTEKASKDATVSFDM